MDDRFRRIVHTFDFDERDEGNLEAVPKYWLRFGGPDFPEYVDGRFDTDVGHQAPPSFYLTMEGRNVAYRYAGPELPVVPNCDYFVSGWAKPDRLKYARVAMSAYYLDREWLPIDGTQHFSRLIGGDPYASEWSELSVYVPAGPPQAAFVGITMWIVQAEIWDRTPRSEHHIEHRDVVGGAWLDDVGVYRLPRASLRPSQPGGVFIAPDRPALEVVVSDNDTFGLEAELRVTPTGASEPVWSRPIPVNTGNESANDRIIMDLPYPGHFHAVLDIQAEGRSVASRELDFVWLFEATREPGATSRPFGVVLDRTDRSPAELEVAFIAGLGVGSAKIPLHSPSAGPVPASRDDNKSNRLLPELIKRHISLTGLIDSSDILSGQDPLPSGMPLIGLLNDDASAWGPLLSRAVTPYVSMLQTWQVGADADRTLATHPQLGPILKQVRLAMTDVLASPSLAVPAIATWQSRPLPVESICLYVPEEIAPDRIADHVIQYRNMGFERVEAHINLPEITGFDRVSSLSRWARSIIETRFAGIDTVYVPQPWRTRSSSNAGIREPMEVFVIFRTIADVLNDFEPAESFALAEGAEVRVFRHAGQTVWALWDRYADQYPRTHVVQLGSATELIDLWGRQQTLEVNPDGRQEIDLSPLPVFVTGIEPWFTTLRATAKLVPEKSEFSLGAHSHELVLRNSSSSVLTGNVVMEVPDTWKVTPRSFHINIEAGSERAFPIELEYASNEAAGSKQIVAKVTTSSPQVHYLEIPVTFSLEMEKLEVWTYAIIQGNDLILRHGMTNHSGQPVSFKLYATAPGRSRQNRTIAHLQPGGMTVNEFHFREMDDLHGRTVRLSLREIDGWRIHNLNIEVP